MVTSMQNMRRIRELVLFRLAGSLFGIDILYIQEIIKNMAYTRVHDAADCIKGVLNLRGQIVSVMDMRTLLRRASEDVDNESQRMLIINHMDESVGLLVDEIDDIINVDPSGLEQGATQMEDVESDYFMGVYKLETDIVIILDIERILNIEDESSAVA